MPKNKTKGSNIERELYKKITDSGYRAVRVAGSGMMENADCDLIAGKKGLQKFAIEVKSSKKPVKYISKDQIQRFKDFCEIFGLKPIIALRFSREKWIFISLKNLKECGKNWVITLENAKKKGKEFMKIFR